MVLYTKSPGYAASLLPGDLAAKLGPAGSLQAGVGAIITSVLEGNGDLLAAPHSLASWGPILLSESSPGSQYDRLIALVRDGNALPDRTVCQAGAGTDFHGFKGRSWAALPGNLHLAVHLAPGAIIDRFQIAFTILAALSVADAVARIPDLERLPRIKWVNDILLGDAKVGGVLAYTQSQGELVTSAVLGIGLNVDTTPEVEPTPFVPEVASVRDFVSPARRGLQTELFLGLLDALDRNYSTLLQEGVSSLMERYQERSMVVGEEVTVCTEVSDRSLQIVAQGRVTGLNENLELLLEGHPQPISGGRLVMGRPPPEVYDWIAEADPGASASAITDRAATEGRARSDR